MKTRDEQLAEMEADIFDLRHGTAYGYEIGCRCYDCEEAKRVFDSIRKDIQPRSPRLPR